MSDYYDGTKILSLKDVRGEQPELVMVDGTRTAGKTTYFNRWFVNKFIKKKEQFMLLYRYQYELSCVSNTFFGDIGNLFFPEYHMTEESAMRGGIKILYLNDEVCGYAVYINNPDIIKKNSHMFSGVQRMLFDEFQTESGNYCQDEVSKLFSVHTSVARGRGEQVRFVPVYMLSNSVSIINPYYSHLGIHKRLKSDTRFLKGDGWVLERCYNEGAKNAQLSSAFNRAFSNTKYASYSREGVYLNDNDAFIDRPDGLTQYLLTFVDNGKWFSVKKIVESDLIYCDNRVDKTYPIKIVRDVADHREGFTMIDSGTIMVMNLKKIFMEGRMRFKDLECKNAILDLLSIKVN